MLINKYLLQHHIFIPRSLDCNYINVLLELGLSLLVVEVNGSNRKLTKILTTSKIDTKNIFKYDILTISEIKQVLFYIKTLHSYA